MQHYFKVPLMDLFVIYNIFVLAMVTCAGGLFVQICDKRRGLNSAQVSMCYQYRDTFIPLVIRAQHMAMNECRSQFSGRRWNCTFPKKWKAPHLIKPQMDLATKEAGFVSALTTASVMHKVSRACYENKLKDFCGCSEESRPDDLAKKHKWGWCGDNLEYGAKFTKKFVDASEDIHTKDDAKLERVLMNLHNNEAGRIAVFDKSFIQCLCHGKMCATKICFRQLGPFKNVGKRLEELHQSSYKVKLAQKISVDAKTNEKDTVDKAKPELAQEDSGYNSFTSKDLVYIKDSPSYCDFNENLSIFGTKGRKCVKNDRSLNDCQILCCGRGHHTRRERITEQCGCEFVNYQLKCKTCEREENVRYCK